MQNAAIHMKRSQEAQIHQSTTSVHHILMCDDQGSKRPRQILADSRRFPPILADSRRESKNITFGNRATGPHTPRRIYIEAQLAPFEDSGHCNGWATLAFELQIAPRHEPSARVLTCRRQTYD